MGMHFSAILNADRIVDPNDVRVVQIESGNFVGSQEFLELFSKTLNEPLESTWYKSEDFSEMCDKPEFLSDQECLRSKDGFYIKFLDNGISIWHPLRWLTFLRDTKWRIATISACVQYFQLFAAHDAVITRDGSFFIEGFEAGQSIRELAKNSTDSEPEYHNFDLLYKVYKCYNTWAPSGYVRRSKSRLNKNALLFSDLALDCQKVETLNATAKEGDNGKLQAQLQEVRQDAPLSKWLKGTPDDAYVQIYLGNDSMPMCDVEGVAKDAGWVRFADIKQFSPATCRTEIAGAPASGHSYNGTAFGIRMPSPENDSVFLEVVPEVPRPNGISEFRTEAVVTPDTVLQIPGGVLPAAWENSKKSVLYKMNMSLMGDSTIRILLDAPVEARIVPYRKSDGIEFIAVLALCKASINMQGIGKIITSAVEQCRHYIASSSLWGLEILLTQISVPRPRRIARIFIPRDCLDGFRFDKVPNESKSYTNTRIGCIWYVPVASRTSVTAV